MSSLGKRLSYLGIADFDYLSARLLMIHGPFFTALPKAAEAIGKLLKLFILLEAKISRDEELGPAQLKTYGHNLSKLFDLLKSRVSAKFENEWDDYIELLQDSYNKHYPENWDEHAVGISGCGNCFRSDSGIWENRGDFLCLEVPHDSPRDGVRGRERTDRRRVGDCNDSGVEAARGCRAGWSRVGGD